MLPVVQKYCYGVTADLLPKYNEDKKNMYIRTRDASTVENSIQALSLSANEEQKLLIQGLLESFQKVSPTTQEVVKAAEESKRQLVEAKEDVREALRLLSELYVTMEFEQVDSHEERTKLFSAVACINRLFNDKVLFGPPDVRNHINKKEDEPAVAPYENNSHSSIIEEPAPFTSSD